MGQVKLKRETLRFRISRLAPEGKFGFGVILTEDYENEPIFIPPQIIGQTMREEKAVSYDDIIGIERYASSVWSPEHGRYRAVMLTDENGMAAPPEPKTQKGNFISEDGYEGPGKVSGNGGSPQKDLEDWDEAFAEIDTLVTDLGTICSALEKAFRSAKRLQRFSYATEEDDTFSSTGQQPPEELKSMVADMVSKMVGVRRHAVRVPKYSRTGEGRGGYIEVDPDSEPHASNYACLTGEKKTAEQWMKQVARPAEKGIPSVLSLGSRLAGVERHAMLAPEHHGSLRVYDKAIFEQFMDMLEEGMDLKDWDGFLWTGNKPSEASVD